MTHVQSLPSTAPLPEWFSFEILQDGTWLVPWICTECWRSGRIEAHPYTPLVNIFSAIIGDHATHAPACTASDVRSICELRAFAQGATHESEG
jgi:hypothetical protein